MSKLLEKLQKQCRVKEAEVLADSIYYTESEQVSTPVPMVNVALSGNIKGGLQAGLTMLVGNSRTFKCFDGETPITVVSDEHDVFSGVQTTYKQLYDMIVDNPSQEWFVSDHFGNLVKIEGMVKKLADVVEINFDLDVRTDNDELSEYMFNSVLRVGRKHAFMSKSGHPVFAEDLKVRDEVISVSGVKATVASIDTDESSEFLNQVVYDISIPAPHWYVPDPSSGIVSHNTNFALLMAASYMAHHKDAIMIFYDSEFGSPQSYFDSFGIDTTRVLHVPIKNIEDFKFDVVPQLENLKRSDKVVIVVDSIGNLASKKEVDDAMSENTAADMTRAKQIKSVFRMITPYLKMKDVPMIVINHIYQSQSFIPTDIVSGGTGIFLSSDSIIKVGRRQQKTGTEVTGYEFILNIEKSRFVKEKSKIPITVSWEGGIQKWSGLTEIAILGGYVVKPKNGWFTPWDKANNVALGKNCRMKDTLKKEFWDPIFEKTDFAEFIQTSYKIPDVDMLAEEPSEAHAPELLQIED
jgi:RecA/RadA recombinase